MQLSRVDAEHVEDQLSRFQKHVQLGRGVARLSVSAHRHLFQHAAGSCGPLQSAGHLFGLLCNEKTSPEDRQGIVDALVLAPPMVLREMVPQLLSLLSPVGGGQFDSHVLVGDPPLTPFFLCLLSPLRSFSIFWLLDCLFCFLWFVCFGDTAIVT